MLAFIRRLTSSRLGVIVTFVVLILIALAFAAGDVTGLSLGGGGMTRTSVATVGDTAIGTAEFEKRVRDEMEGARRQEPGLDMARFVAGGGFTSVLEQMINGLAMEEFGRDQGMVVGKKLVDSTLASIPALQGPTGKFDQAIYERLLSQQRLTDAQARADIARDIIARHLILPTIGAAQVPEQVALPYAALLLEKRSGRFALIPTTAVNKGPPPTEAEAQSWYRRNIARYSLPERRVIQYALVTPERVKDQATPSDAEIAEAYRASAAKYRPTEKRTVTQVTVLDQNAANALAIKVKGGATIAAAARAAGLEPRTIAGVEKAGYAAQTSPAVADAVFSAARGAVVGPVRAAIGFVVARVDSVEQVPGKTLAQARGEIAAELGKQKTADALARVQDAIGDSIDNNANFKELVADQKLQARATPPLTAEGIDPADPGAKPDPALAQIVAAGFAAAEGDEPTIVPVGQDGGFAVVAVDRIVGAAPRPLAEVREQAARDFAADRARRGARAAAAGVVAALSKGTPLPRALAATGLKLPPVRSAVVPRSELAANPRGAPPALALLFSMPEGSAKMIEAPDSDGWLVVKLDGITPGDPARRPEVVAAARNDIGRVVGQEYVLQFTTAVRRAVKVKRNDDAIARVKADLTGNAANP